MSWLIPIGCAILSLLIEFLFLVIIIGTDGDPPTWLFMVIFIVSYIGLLTLAYGIKNEKQLKN